MNYELHLTIKTPRDIEKFKKDCTLLDVKPIIIETEEGEKYGQQVMTSSKYSSDSYLDYLDTLHNLFLDLVLKGYVVIRQKVEISPKEEKHQNHKYYESHLRLKLPKDFNRRDLLGICLYSNFHLSKNLFKRSEDFDYQMITYRNSNTSYKDFIEHIREMRRWLDERDIEFDKIEVEECILDTNLKLDSSWIN